MLLKIKLIKELKMFKTIPKCPKSLLDQKKCMMKHIKFATKYLFGKAITIIQSINSCQLVSSHSNRVKYGRPTLNLLKSKGCKGLLVYRQKISHLYSQPLWHFNEDKCLLWKNCRIQEGW
jgi:hypothetical protein